MAVDKFSSAAGPQHGLIKIVPASVTVGSGSGSVDVNGNITFSGVSSIVINGCFTTNYENYRVFLSTSTGQTNAEILLQLTSGGSASGGSYIMTGAGGSATSTITNFPITFVTGYGQTSCEFYMLKPAVAAHTTYHTNWNYDDGGTFLYNSRSGRHRADVSYDGMRIYNPTTMTGNIRVYGYNQ